MPGRKTGSRSKPGSTLRWEDWGLGRRHGGNTDIVEGYLRSAMSKSERLVKTEPADRERRVLLAEAHAELSMVLERDARLAHRALAADLLLLLRKLDPVCGACSGAWNQLAIGPPMEPLIRYWRPSDVSREPLESLAVAS